MARKTALFMAIVPFRYTSATKGAFFMAVYGTGWHHDVMDYCTARQFIRLMFDSVMTHRSWRIRQASCSKRLRKLRPRACSTFLCYGLAPIDYTFVCLKVYSNAKKKGGFYRVCKAILEHCRNVSKLRFETIGGNISCWIILSII